MTTRPMHSGKIQGDLFDGTLDGYHKAAQNTAMYPGKGTFWGVNYCVLKMNGEAGEIAEKVGKMMRDDGYGPFTETKDIASDKTVDLIRELGDVLWYVSAAAAELGVDLHYVAEMNIKKLKDRQQRGTLSGSGDNR